MRSLYLAESFFSDTCSVLSCTTVAGRSRFADVMAVTDSTGETVDRASVVLPVLLVLEVHRVPLGPPVFHV